VTGHEEVFEVAPDNRTDEHEPAAARASLWKRCNCRGSMVAAKGSTFSATRRPSEICSASYTTPIPPRPTSRKMRKSPSVPLRPSSRVSPSAGADLSASSIICSAGTSLRMRSAAPGQRAA